MKVVYALSAGFNFFEELSLVGVRETPVGDNCI